MICSSLAATTAEFAVLTECVGTAARSLTAARATGDDIGSQRQFDVGRERQATRAQDIFHAHGRETLVFAIAHALTEGLLSLATRARRAGEQASQKAELAVCFSLASSFFDSFDGS